MQTNKIINAKFQHYFLYYFIHTMKLFLYVDTTDVTNIYLNHIFELLLQKEIKKNKKNRRFRLRYPLNSGK